MKDFMKKLAIKFGWVVTVKETVTCTCKEDMKYSGWTNRETWAVNLWVENEQYLTDERDNMLRNLDANDYFFTTLEDSVRNWFEGQLEQFKDDNPKFALTLIEDIGSLYRVNWLELGENWLEGI